VQKISIVPRGRAALGYTLQLPDEDRFLVTRSELLQRLEGLLAGRAAEELCLGEVSSGSEDDLAKATLLARRMVALLGMGERTGLARCAHMGDELQTLHGEVGVGQRDCSDATAKAIDDEVERLLQAAHVAARRRLETHRAHLDRIVGALLEREVLDRDAFLGLLHDEPVRALG
jgi:cell division protease FtsH